MLARLLFLLAATRFRLGLVGLARLLVKLKLQTAAIPVLLGLSQMAAAAAALILRGAKALVAPEDPVEEVLVTQLLVVQSLLQVRAIQVGAAPLSFGQDIPLAAAAGPDLLGPVELMWRVETVELALAMILLE